MPVAALLAHLAEAPERAALLLDVDGTLAPIVERPEDAAVPEETRAELQRLAARYAVVAFVSGRAGDEARRVVGLPELTYVGAHGLELESAAEQWRQRLHDFAAGVDWPVEDKGLTVSFHYRTADDEEAARATLERVAEEARHAGLRPRFGRKVLELSPPVEASKETAVRKLLERAGVRRALYAGDDTTDLDAFRGLDGLELAIRVAVASPEGPAELGAAADLVVDGPEGLLELLRRL